MKTIILTTALIFSLTVSCFAQDKSAKATTNNSSTNPLYIFKIGGQPDIIFNGAPPRLTFATINQSSIKSMEVLKDATATAQFGDQAKNGVIILTLLDSAKLLTKDALFKSYKINEKNSKLPSYLDGLVIPDPEHMYFDQSAVKSVTVETNVDTKQKYINITTINDRENGLGSGLHIRGK